MTFQIMYYLFIVFHVGVLGKKSRIIGGLNTDIRVTPYQVALKYANQELLKCGGSIITYKHILTAAHCVYNRHYSEIKIIAGSTDITNPRWIYYIHYINIHPFYSEEIGGYSVDTHDIAIITLNSTIEFNEYQNKIDLPTSPYNVGTEALISGWGWTTFPAIQTPALLQRASVIIISRSVCGFYFEFPIWEYHMCTLSHLKVGVCTGDSGGPVVSQGKLIGVISFGVPCAIGVPDVHADIYYYINFIRSIVRNHL